MSPIKAPEIPEHLIANPFVQAHQPEKPKYVTKHSYELSKVADTEPWKPSEDVEEYIGDINNITIFQLNSENAQFDFVEKELIKAQQVGLVVLGKHIDRNHRPPLIALTTRNKIYIIFTNDDGYINFLKEKIDEARIQFWTTQGLYEADSLAHNFGIYLKDAKSCNDCQAMHAHMMTYVAHLPDPKRSCYSELVQKNSKYKPNIESFERLIEIWLGVPADDIKIDAFQLEHLYTFPLNATALNTIKKRCVLVLPLGAVLQKSIWRDTQELSLSYCRRLSCIADDKLYKLTLETELNLMSENGDGLDLEGIVAIL